ncbi:preprotein translocase subunit YajC [Sinosporangium album]|uniref:Preprotein translocase subunit YajC n=1 Tax=Sinosporangium album TaxID=504805 RepID=A0A1G8IVH5_9ACTN|nr:preprotein translocase subunit YajC [Sinosporangium album]SDI22994.1 preprotein translocase subunit YajC [Sinosporangium album]
MGDITSFLPLILLVVVFYFLLIRPQRKRQREQLEMQNSLAPGTRVMTTTGLFGTVVAVDNEDVILELAPGVETRWVKAAVGRVIEPYSDAKTTIDPVDDVTGLDDAEEKDVKDKDGSAGNGSDSPGKQP